jgi:hypothetical protein
MRGSSTTTSHADDLIFELLSGVVSRLNDLRLIQVGDLLIDPSWLLLGLLGPGFPSSIGLHKQSLETPHSIVVAHDVSST